MSSTESYGGQEHEPPFLPSRRDQVTAEWLHQVNYLVDNPDKLECLTECRGFDPASGPRCSPLLS